MRFEIYKVKCKKSTACTITVIAIILNFFTFIFYYFRDFQNTTVITRFLFDIVPIICTVHSKIYFYIRQHLSRFADFIDLVKPCIAFFCRILMTRKCCPPSLSLDSHVYDLMSCIGLIWFIGPFGLVCIFVVVVLSGAVSVFPNPNTLRKYPQ